MKVVKVREVDIEVLASKRREAQAPVEAPLTLEIVSIVNVPPVLVGILHPRGLASVAMADRMLEREGINANARRISTSSIPTAKG